MAFVLDSDRHPKDVCSGRGKGRYLYSGNVDYRRGVATLHPKWIQNKDLQSEIENQVFDDVIGSNGRFLQKEGKGWRVQTNREDIVSSKIHKAFVNTKTSFNNGDDAMEEDGTRAQRRRTGYNGNEREINEARDDSINEAHDDSINEARDDDGAGAQRQWTENDDDVTVSRNNEKMVDDWASRREKQETGNDDDDATTNSSKACDNHVNDGMDGAGGKNLWTDGNDDDDANDATNNNNNNDDDDVDVNDATNNNSNNMASNSSVSNKPRPLPKINACHAMPCAFVIALFIVVVSLALVKRTAFGQAVKVLHSDVAPIIIEQGGKEGETWIGHDYGACAQQEARTNNGDNDHEEGDHDDDGTIARVNDDDDSIAHVNDNDDGIACVNDDNVKVLVWFAPTIIEQGGKEGETWIGYDFGARAQQEATNNCGSDNEEGDDDDSIARGNNNDDAGISFGNDDDVKVLRSVAPIIIEQGGEEGETWIGYDDGGARAQQEGTNKEGDDNDDGSIARVNNDDNSIAHVNDNDDGIACVHDDDVKVLLWFAPIIFEQGGKEGETWIGYDDGARAQQEATNNCGSDNEEGDDDDDDSIARGNDNDDASIACGNDDDVKVLLWFAPTIIEQGGKEGEAWIGYDDDGARAQQVVTNNCGNDNEDGDDDGSIARVNDDDDTNGIIDHNNHATTKRIINIINDDHDIFAGALEFEWIYNNRDNHATTNHIVNNNSDVCGVGYEYNHDGDYDTEAQPKNPVPAYFVVAALFMKFLEYLHRLVFGKQPNNQNLPPQVTFPGHNNATKASPSHHELNQEPPAEAHALVSQQLVGLVSDKSSPIEHEQNQERLTPDSDSDGEDRMESNELQCSFENNPPGKLESILVFNPPAIHGGNLPDPFVKTPTLCDMV